MRGDLESLERRRFLQLLSASAAVTAAACSGPPEEKILPFAHAPEYDLPGEPRYYATALQRGGYGMGVLVKNTDGRPIKVEGNPLHPASLGGTDVYAQAAVLDMWDPARSQTVLQTGELATRDEFLRVLQIQLRAFAQNRGEGLRILTRTVCSPVLGRQLQELIEKFPRARWHQYDPLHEDNAIAATQLAFGRPLEAVYRFDHARRLLCLDADFLQGGAASVRYARDFSRLRNPDNGSMSRVFAVESTPGLIGAAADQRLALRPDEIENMVYRLAAALGMRAPLGRETELNAFEAAVLAELEAHPGECLIVAGASLTPAARAWVHALNLRLKADDCVYFIESPEIRAENQIESLRELTEAMAAGVVESLFILGGNPIYDAPADLAFAEKLRKVPFTAHLSQYVNETSRVCRWHLPQTHEFEQWSDLKAFDGTQGIVQPLMAPLYRGISVHELLSWILQAPRSSHEVVKEFYRQRQGLESFDEFWNISLRKGLIEGSAALPVEVKLQALERSESPSESANWTLTFAADSAVRDGEYAHNAWLQELPRPLTRLTWDNAALIDPQSAAELELATGDLIDIAVKGARVSAPAWVLPGQAAHCVTLPLGYGHEQADHAGARIGVDAYPLRRSDGWWRTGNVTITRLPGRYDFASTQTHSRMEDREPVRSATLRQFQATPRFATQLSEDRAPSHSLYPEHRYDSYRWAMSIDLNACIGCGACTIACQAENNIPVVGKEQVRRGREMHWIRVDRYYSGNEPQPRTFFQPVPCMHCEHAPCEEVCPVGATLHDSEGLNVQVYNRCVGTRFCSNNCPYKVRRFNFLQFSNQNVESLKAAQNPEVTVRQRGVMEKCSYCLQRITRARIEAERLGREIRDGEVVTACQAVCPTQAIVFGDLHDPQAKIHESKSSPRNYSLLAELNTRPRTTYLARVSNPRDEE